MTQPAIPVQNSSPVQSTSPASDDLDAVADLATGLTHRDLHRAALAVCAASTDVDDARDLLDALGLLDQLRGPGRLAG